MALSVYIETTIPSFYHETRQSRIILTWRDVTRRWWDRYRAEYRLFTSEYVLEELRHAPDQKAEQAIALLEGIPVLEEPSGLIEAAEYYVQHRLMPVEAGGDAVHLAMASLHHMDYLLTWNCQHLANANKIQHIAVLNGRLGLPVPVITTPLTLMPEETT
ncbi:MAG: type II toxin-antitoxin system VapC family toxin [Planctomycetota bacterium]